MTVEVPSDEIVDLLLGDLVEVLEPANALVSPRTPPARGKTNALVHRAELGDVESVRENSICERTRISLPFLAVPPQSLKLTRLPLQKVLALVRGDVTDSRKNVSAVRRAPLDAVAVVDPPLARLVVDVKVGEVVVEVDAAGAEVPTEQGGVSREDGRHVNVALAAERDGESCEPLVEVGDDGLGALSGRELQSRISSSPPPPRKPERERTSPRNQATR